MGYFRALISVCTGLSGFSELARTPWWRVLLHYLFTVIVATVIITIGQYPKIKQSLTVSRFLAAEEFGAITESGYGGFNVEKEPDLPRTIRLPRNIAMIYLPNTEAEPPSLPQDAFAGVLFSPVHLILWSQSGTTKMFPLAPARYSGASFAPIPYTAENLRTLLAAPAPETAYAPGTSPAAIFVNLLSIGWKPLIFVSWFAVVVGQTLMFLLIVAFIFGTIGTNRVNRLVTMKEMFALTFYPAFPAILVASLLPALDINVPFFDFNLAFLLGAMGYTLVAINYVAAKRIAEQNNPLGKGENNE